MPSDRERHTPAHCTGGRDRFPAVEPVSAIVQRHQCARDLGTIIGMCKTYLENATYKRALIFALPVRWRRHPQPNSHRTVRASGIPPPTDLRSSPLCQPCAPRRTQRCDGHHGRLPTIVWACQERHIWLAKILVRASGDPEPRPFLAHLMVDCTML